jgi:hypothetical protein
MGLVFVSLSLSLSLTLACIIHFFGGNMLPPPHPFWQRQGKTASPQPVAVAPAATRAEADVSARPPRSRKPPPPPPLGPSIAELLGLCPPVAAAQPTPAVLQEAEPVAPVRKRSLRLARAHERQQEATSVAAAEAVVAAAPSPPRPAPSSDPPPALLDVAPRPTHPFFQPRRAPSPAPLPTPAAAPIADFFLSKEARHARTLAAEADKLRRRCVQPASASKHRHTDTDTHTHTHTHTRTHTHTHGSRPAPPA